MNRTDCMDKLGSAHRMTPSGRYVVADVTDPGFYPGKIPGRAYQDPGDHAGPWFFWPADWLDETFGGVVSAWLTGFPMCYSPGYATADDALNAATEWEAGKEQRKIRQNRVVSFLQDMDPPAWHELGKTGL